MCTHNENLLSYRIASFLIKRSRSVTSTISLKMSGHSTPKRLLEDDVQDSQNDDYAFPPKRNKLVADQTEHGIFRSSSNSPCIIPSSTPIINAAIQTTRVHLANGGIKLPREISLPLTLHANLNRFKPAITTTNTKAYSVSGLISHP